MLNWIVCVRVYVCACACKCLRVGKSVCLLLFYLNWFHTPTATKSCFNYFFSFYEFRSFREKTQLRTVMTQLGNDTWFRKYSLIRLLRNGGFSGNRAMIVHMKLNNLQLCFANTLYSLKNTHTRGHTYTQSEKGRGRVGGERVRYKHVEPICTRCCRRAIPSNSIIELFSVCMAQSHRQHVSN